MDQQAQKNFMLGAFMGGVLAAATTLLFTPVSGRRLRNQVRNRIQRMEHGKVAQALRPAIRKHPRKATARKAKKH